MTIPTDIPSALPTQRDKRRHPWPWLVVGLLGGFILGIPIGGAGKGNTAAPAVGATTVVTSVVTASRSVVTIVVTAPPSVVTVHESAAPAPPPPAPAGPATTISDGTWVVGTDIQSGTYRTSGPSTSAVPFCYWERSRGTSGEIGDVIANDNVSGPTTVTIKASDKAFKSQYCMQWTKIG